MTRATSICILVRLRCNTLIHIDHVCPPDGMQTVTVTPTPSPRVVLRTPHQMHKMYVHTRPRLHTHQRTVRMFRRTECR